MLDVGVGVGVGVGAGAAMVKLLEVLVQDAVLVLATST
jgi:hypothetical protein